MQDLCSEEDSEHGFRHRCTRLAFDTVSPTLLDFSVRYASERSVGVFLFFIDVALQSHFVFASIVPHQEKWLTLQPYSLTSCLSRY